MSAISERFLCHGYFPKHQDAIPFGEMLNRLFFDPMGDNIDFPIHGPNSIRLLETLLDHGNFLKAQGIFRKDENGNHNNQGAEESIGRYYKRIMQSMGNDSSPFDRAKNKDLLTLAILFHDIGKTIRRANHPPIGANLIRNYDETQRQLLLDSLVYDNEPKESEAKHNRFSLITSIIQHHDKFGVVSTGEGALPLFSDILYFTSDASVIDGIKKNITSVMLTNLADAAAVCTAADAPKIRAGEIVKEITALRKKNGEDPALFAELMEICTDQDSCLGLDAILFGMICA